MTRKIECKSYKSRIEVTDDKKCHRCLKRFWVCDEYSCKRCLKDKITCISQEKKDDRKCNRCQCNNARCNKKRSCSLCIKEEKSCDYFDNDNLVRRLYATKVDRIQELFENENECKQCKANRRNCSDTKSCYKCVKHKETNCTWRRQEKVIEYFCVESFRIENSEIVLSNDQSLSIKKPDVRTHFEAEYLQRKRKKRSEKTEESYLTDTESQSNDIQTRKELFDFDDSDTSESKSDTNLNNDLVRSRKVAQREAKLIAITIVKNIHFDSRIYKEVMRLSDVKYWKKAIENEMQSIVTNNMFELVDLLKEKRAVSTKWMFKRKLEFNEKVLKYKVRLVVRNFQQQQEIDFNEMYSEVIKPTFYRILFALTAILDWISH